MRSALKKVENGWSVSVSSEAVEAAGLYDGAPVDVTVDGEAVVVRLHEPTIEDLVLQMEDKEQPPLEWEFVKPVGSEVW